MARSSYGRLGIAQFQLATSVTVELGLLLSSVSLAYFQSARFQFELRMPL